MPYTKTVIEMGTAVTIVGGILMWIGSRVFVTKKDCKETRDECNSKVCKRIDKLSDQITSDKNEAISRRETMETTIHKAIKSNRELVNQHYSEVKEFMGLIKGILSNKK